MKEGESSRVRLCMHGYMCSDPQLGKAITKVLESSAKVLE
jgi:hypothetical protein